MRFSLRYAPVLADRQAAASIWGINSNFDESFKRLDADAVTALYPYRDSPAANSGTFRGRVAVTHYYDPANNLWVIVDLSNIFVAGWKLYPSQVVDLLVRGNVK